MIVEPRLLRVVRMHLGEQVDALRPFPVAAQTGGVLQRRHRSGYPGAGVPAVVPLHRM